MSKALLALEDGTTVAGKGLGKPGISTGELVFTTTFTGYEESLTDPSYKGQNLMFTYPLIGNYGFHYRSAQSESIQAEGVVVREACKSPSHRDSKISLDNYLRENGSRGIAGIDSRALTVKIREQGTVKSAIAVGNHSKQEVIEAAINQPAITEMDLIPEVTTQNLKILEGPGPRLGVIDTGTKKNILSNLSNKGFELVLFPYQTDISKIKEYQLDGLFFTNGPGDPKKTDHAQKIVKHFLGKIPIFGICFGAQIISLALGGDTYKLKFGHRGANQPVLNQETGIVGITAQNHGFAISEESLGNTPLMVTETNAIDGTVEAIESRTHNTFAVQYHPEGSPGPKDKESWFFEKVAQLTMASNAKKN